jgi:1,4-alpha-glucan branching enzyme
MPPINGCNCLYLVGKFNEWNESVYRMQRTEDGTWCLALDLEPGRCYQYRYRTDNGVWLNDLAVDA